ncbi:MAG: monovalent cation/H+ antiporter subunit D family protein [Deltaproteobacteria bacterium]|nr:monovalent cation/H+ antiporter subunit D family protein [Deltaproteobacteria bacterium]
MTEISLKPLFAIGIPAVAAALILLSRKNANVREFWSLFAGVVKFLIVISMVPAVLHGVAFEYTAVEFFQGVGIKFRVDALGLMFAATASFLWILTSVYSIGYMRSTNERSQTRYFACFAVSMCGAVGAAFSANLLTLYLFYELITIATYPLVSHKDTEEALAGGKKYLVYLLGTSKAFLLPAMVLTYTIAGTLEFTKGGIFHASEPMLLTVVYVLFMAGFAKAAIMPFHNWLPSAMVAPTPVSALLHAVAVVKVGVFSILRVMLYIFGVDMMRSLGLGMPTVFVVSFTIIAASIIALTKDNLKARLAYSTISQLSYIVLGGALLSPSGITGGIIHITNHAFAKITLFFCAGSIYVASHKTKISEMAGIGRKMPFTMTAFSIGVLGMIGVPSVGGFISKWYLARGALEAGSITILMMLLASTVLNAAYFIPIVYTAFFGNSHEGAHGEGRGEHEGGPHAEDHGAGGQHDTEIKENLYVVVPLVISAVGSVVLGFYPDALLMFIRRIL